MIDLDAIAQREIARRNAITEPEGRPFPNPLEAKYISVSFITKATAEKYAQTLLGMVENDNVPAYFGFRGNGLSDALLRHITPHRELDLVATGLLPDDWFFSGHPDGLEVLPEKYLCADEDKSHQHVTEEEDDRIDVARRQGTLYVAMAIHEYETANHIDLELSRFSDETCRAITLPADLKTDGAFVFVNNLGANSPIHSGGFVSRNVLNQTLDFYTRKAEAILQSMRDGNLDAARSWDRSPEGLTEFTRHTPEMFEGPQHDFVLAHALAKHDADSTIKAAEAVKAISQAEVLAVMSSTGQESLSLSDGTVIKAVGGFGGARKPWLRVKAAQEDE